MRDHRYLSRKSGHSHLYTVYPVCDAVLGKFGEPFHLNFRAWAACHFVTRSQGGRNAGPSHSRVPPTYRLGYVASERSSRPPSPCTPTGGEPDSGRVFGDMFMDVPLHIYALVVPLLLLDPSFIHLTPCWAGVRSSSDPLCVAQAQDSIPGSAGDDSVFVRASLGVENVIFSSSSDQSSVFGGRQGSSGEGMGRPRQGPPPGSGAELAFRFKRAVKDFFLIDERKSSIGAEIRAGAVSFLTMSYILLVNPQILSQVRGVVHAG